MQRAIACETWSSTGRERAAALFGARFEDAIGRGPDLIVFVSQEFDLGATVVSLRQVRDRTPTRRDPRDELLSTPVDATGVDWRDANPSP